MPSRCAWCHDAPVARRGARYCSHSCRQRAYEDRRGQLAFLNLLVAATCQAYHQALQLQAAALKRHTQPSQIHKEAS